MAPKHPSIASTAANRSIAGRVSPTVRRALNPARDRVRVAVTAASARLGRVGPLPDHLVIGAQRSGTTWLQKLLAAHPDIVAPRTKEVHYFDLHWGRGPRWYRANFAAAAAASARRSPGQPEVHTGEATPYMLFHPLGPLRVAATVPDARLVVVLRDPVDRAWSHWRHARHLGVEREPFARAIALEERRLEGADERLRAHPGARHRSHQHHSYVARGRYARQLAAWYEHFPRDQVLVLWFDDLVQRPDSVLAGVANHLDVAPFAAIPRPDRPVERAAPPEPALAAELRARFEADDRALAELLGSIPPWRR